MYYYWHLPHYPHHVLLYGLYDCRRLLVKWSFISIIM